MKPVFPSEPLNFCGIIRVYEHSTCEIPLLSGQNLALWRPAPAVRSLQKNLDDSPPQARSPSYPDARPNPQPDLSRTVHASAPVQPPVSGSPAEFPLSISTSASALCDPRQSPSTSPRASHPLPQALPRGPLTLLADGL